MASFFNLTLDTLAPAGLSLILNDGAQYATSATVTAKISVTDAATTGYQMKIWGTKAAAKEADASWETFAATKSITLPDGDGLKTITLKEGESAGPCPGVPREKYLSRSALSDLAQTGSALKEIGIELSRICQAIAGLEDLFRPLGDEDKCHQSYTSTLYQAALAAQGEEAKISLGLTASLRLQGLPALSMVCESILNSTDLLKSSLKSFNHAYIARLTLK